jgi:hypothetical protein
MTKRILIEISGGDADGRTFDSASTDPIEKQMVQSLLHMTRNGTEGKAFHGLSISACEAMSRGKLAIKNTKASSDGSTHKYTVLERHEDDDGILIRIGYSVNR